MMSGDSNNLYKAYDFIENSTTEKSRELHQITMMLQSHLAHFVNPAKNPPAA